MTPRRRLAGLASALLTTVLAIGLLPGAPAASADHPRPERADGLLTLLGPDRLAISPNLPDLKRSATIRYRLTRKAEVRVRVTTVSRPHHAYSVDHLGQQGRGRHTYRWRGQQAGVGQLPAGVYRVELRAQRRGHPASAVTRTVRVRIRTAPREFTWARNRDVVYPRTSLFTDRIALVITGVKELETYDQDGAATAEGDVDDFDAAVLDYDGDLVRDLHPEFVACDGRYYPSDASCLSASWDGRSTGGGVAPAGTYRFRVTSTGPAGHQDVSERPVTVSPRRLVERTRRVTVLPSELPVTSTPCYDSSSLACGDLSCLPSASQRFPGGLSFGICQPAFGDATFATAYFGGPPRTAGPIDAFRGDTGHERFRIRATGGPAPAGIGSAVLGAGDAEEPQVRLVGDGTFTLPAVEVSSYAGPQDLAFYPLWSVRGQTGDRWDLASLRITFTDFVPAS